jgi:mannose-6-phosphate isomerase
MSQAGRIRNWLTGSALPLWAGAGVDPQGGFVERLRLDGTPNHDAAKRVRVQARQIYVYAHAQVLGLYPHGTLLARRAYDFLMANAWLPDGGGFAHLLARGGAIVDARRDTYDHAFVLLALAWLYRATRDRDILATLERTLAAIDRHLKAPRLDGYLEDDRRSLPRRQNPHMHLLEALLAIHEATGEGAPLERASEIVSLFDRFFFDRARSALVEFYTQEWRPAAGDTGRIVEPGHHFEWIWLLHQFARLKGEAVHPGAKALYEFANQCGVEAGTGLVIDEVFVDRKIKSASKRCWPQTEALKAELALSEAAGRGAPINSTGASGAGRGAPINATGASGAGRGAPINSTGASGAGHPIAKRADAIVDNIFSTYLDQPVAGGWVDIVDASNAPIAASIPASTFYHVFVAFTEYLRLDNVPVAR